MRRSKLGVLCIQGYGIAFGLLMLLQRFKCEQKGQSVNIAL